MRFSISVPHIFNNLTRKLREPKRIRSTTYTRYDGTSGLILSYEAQRNKGGQYTITGAYGVGSHECHPPTNIRFPGTFDLRGAIIRLFELEQHAQNQRFTIHTPSDRHQGSGLSTIASRFKIANPYIGVRDDWTRAQETTQKILGRLHKNAVNHTEKYRALG